MISFVIAAAIAVQSGCSSSSSSSKQLSEREIEVGITDEELENHFGRFVDIPLIPGMWADLSRARRDYFFDYNDAFTRFEENLQKWKPIADYQRAHPNEETVPWKYSRILEEWDKANESMESIREEFLRVRDAQYANIRKERSRRDSYRKLVLNMAKTKQVPSKRMIVDENFVGWIERVYYKNEN